ncbi:hypothetical protein BDQ12DRAFT_682225 [Crucibulum laeve]|uniref:Uncharacterized protein n=1 Tax=Crucibulum laeve TaxID=68775 RepID=A0A5C3M145_9AGAR|nr:hypothetical protein BDQ12DRAFT_682225 [Crucibulum laeve]
MKLLVKYRSNLYSWAETGSTMELVDCNAVHWKCELRSRVPDEPALLLLVAPAKYPFQLSKGVRRWMYECTSDRRYWMIPRGVPLRLPADSGVQAAIGFMRMLVVVMSDGDRVYIVPGISIDNKALPAQSTRARSMSRGVAKWFQLASTPLQLIVEPTSRTKDRPYMD